MVPLLEIALCNDSGYKYILSAFSENSAQLVIGNIVQESDLLSLLVL